MPMALDPMVIFHDALADAVGSLDSVPQTERTTLGFLASLRSRIETGIESNQIGYAEELEIRYISSAFLEAAINYYQIRRT